MSLLQILRHPDAPVLYIRFSGDVLGADLVTALTGAYASPLRQAGDASIWDLTPADSVVADLKDLHLLNQQGAALALKSPPGPIFIVAPQQDVYTLARLYAVHGARTGRRIEVLHTLEEAWRLLGVPSPDFAGLVPLHAAG